MILILETKLFKNRLKLYSMNLIKKKFFSILNILVTTEDNILNIDISKTSFLNRLLFLLTNIPYFYLVYYISTTYKTNFDSNSDLICKYSTHFFIFLLSFISTIFHFKQCTCYNKNKINNCILWNNIDLSCVGITGILISICYIKSFYDILYFSPCIILMILGGFFKSKKLYKLYFIFHGLWHLVSAFFLFHIICV